MITLLRTRREGHAFSYSLNAPHSHTFLLYMTIAKCSDIRSTSYLTNISSVQYIHISNCEYGKESTKLNCSYSEQPNLSML